MSRLSAIRINDPVISNLIRGYSNPEFVGGFLFPTISVLQETGKVPQFSKESFKEYSTLRALRGSSNRMNPESISTTTFILDEHDIEIPIDYREVTEAIYDVRAYSAQVSSRILGLSLEIEQSLLATTAGNYGSGNKVTLSGTSQWTHASGDPVATIMAGHEAIRTATGRYANTLVMGAVSFKALKTNPSILDRVKYSERGIVTTDLLAAAFEVETVAIGKSVKTSDSGTMSDVWGDFAVLAYVPKSFTGDVQALEPSYGATLRKSGQPSADVYTLDGGKVTNVRATDIYKAFILGSDAGYLISDTNA